MVDDAFDFGAAARDLVLVREELLLLHVQKAGCEARLAELQESGMAESLQELSRRVAELEGRARILEAQSAQNAAALAYLAYEETHRAVRAKPTWTEAEEDDWGNQLDIYWDAMGLENQDRVDAITETEIRKHSDPRVEAVIDESKPGSTLEVKRLVLTEEARKSLSVRQPCDHCRGKGYTTSLLRIGRRFVCSVCGGDGRKARA